MRNELRVYSLPRWRVIQWLADAGPDAPDDIRVALIGGLFGTLPIFASGVINTIVVAAAIAARQTTAPFIAWLVFEIVICVARLTVLVVARRAALERRETPTDLYLLLGILWSASVGYGGIISLTSGDWVVATLACASATATVGGVCFRNFSAPRLAATMMLVSLGPFVPGVILAGEPLLYVVFLQVPLYLIAMSAAAYTLNKMLIAIMRAERENDYRAKHDALTGLANREGLADAVAAGLEAAHRDGKDLAVLFLDLDDFKTVNDTFGHAAGDRLLKLAADRLRHSLRATDVAARIGGDEFVVLAEGLTREQAAKLGQKLTDAITAAYDLGAGVFAKIGMSVGIAMVPEHGADAEALLAVADAALYEAKSRRQVQMLQSLVEEQSRHDASDAAERRRAHARA